MACAHVRRTCSAAVCVPPCLCVPIECTLFCGSPFACAGRVCVWVCLVCVRVHVPVCARARILARVCVCVIPHLLKCSYPCLFIRIHLHGPCVSPCACACIGLVRVRRVGPCVESLCRCGDDVLFTDALQATQEYVRTPASVAVS